MTSEELSAQAEEIYQSWTDRAAVLATLAIAAAISEQTEALQYQQNRIVAAIRGYDEPED